MQSEHILLRSGCTNEFILVSSSVRMLCWGIEGEKGIKMCLIIVWKVCPEGASCLVWPMVYSNMDSIPMTSVVNNHKSAEALVVYLGLLSKFRIMGDQGKYMV